jgi:hypothetical protein
MPIPPGAACLHDFFVAKFRSHFYGLVEYDSAGLLAIVWDYLHERTTDYEARRVFESVLGSSAFLDSVHAAVAAGAPPLPARAAEDRGRRANRRRVQRWTSAEDTRLLAGIYRFGPAN